MAEPDGTILCLASYFKGEEFLRECKRRGWHVLLLTEEKLRDSPWPADGVDEILAMPDLRRTADVVKGVSWLVRSRAVDRIVPLDEFDLETAAALREHLRIPGMGQTTARYFRDKLAMRVRAREAGFAVPEFTPLFNDDQVRAFTDRVPPPWLVKPRSSAAAIGIRRIDSAAALWPVVEEIGDERSFQLLERFVTGDVYHVDSIVEDGTVLFAAAFRYGQPPMAVAHEGGIFTTRMLERGSEDERRLQALNRDLLRALGLLRGVTHAEFIRARDDGRFHFIETAARVGGAHIADVIAAATGANLWAEWARIETATPARPYALPELRTDYAGSVISLARQERPDTSAYDDPEIVWRLDKRHHAGLIVASPDAARVGSLLGSYARRFAEDFLATMPAPEKPTS
ncbi:MAG TPA: ATPase [Gemmatimonadota bacterium]